MVDKIVGGLLSAEDCETSNVILDLLGYDGFPACYAMAKVAAGARGVGGYGSIHLPSLKCQSVQEMPQF